MEFLKTWDDYLCYCNFNADLEEELGKRYSPNPWVFQDAVEFSATEQHFAVYYRSFDGARHLTVGVKRIDGVFHFTFSER